MDSIVVKDVKHHNSILIVYDLETFNYNKIRGNRFTEVFIPTQYKDTDLEKEFTNKLQSSITILGRKVGRIYYYNE